MTVESGVDASAKISVGSDRLAGVTIVPPIPGVTVTPTREACDLPSLGVISLPVCNTFYWTEWLLHTGDTRRARLLHAWAMAQPGLEPADRQFGDSLRNGLGEEGDARASVPADAEVETAIVEVLALA